VARVRSALLPGCHIARTGVHHAAEPGRDTGLAGAPAPTATPALAVLEEVAAILAAHGFAGRWGPGGSIGFELASGVRCTTPDSDLDLVLSAETPVTRTDAARLHADLSTLPVRIDLLLETPWGRPRSPSTRAAWMRFCCVPRRAAIGS